MGFDACIIIACQSSYTIQFSSSSYSCNQEDNRSYRINLKPDFVLSPESTSSSNDGEAFSAHQMVIFHVPSNLDFDEFCLEPHLVISEEFQSTPGRITSYGVRVILKTEEDDRQYGINCGNLSKKRKKGYVDSDPTIDFLISFKQRTSDAWSPKYIISSSTAHNQPFSLLILHFYLKGVLKIYCRFWFIFSWPVSRDFPPR